jgi:hypothetical protein
VLPDARQYIEQRPVLAGDEPGRIGGDERQAEAGRPRAQPVVLRLLGAGQMALQLDVDVEAAVDGDQALEEIAGALHVTPGQARRHRAPGAAREADQPRRVLDEIVEGGCALALRCAHLDAGQEPTEVLVSLAVLDQEREPTAAVERHLGADDGLEAEARARAVELGRAVEAVGVDERHGGLLELRRPLGQGLRQGASPRES